MPHAQSASGRRLDYLQLPEQVPSYEWGNRFTEPGPNALHLLRVAGVGRARKAATVAATRLKDGREVWLPPLTGVLSGLHGRRVPLVMVVGSDGAALQVRIGTWASATAAATDPAVVHRRQSVLTTLLEAGYPDITLDEGAGATRGWPRAGYAMGVPSLLTPQREDPAAPVDRLVRAMARQCWQAVVIAQPVPEAVRARQRDGVLNEHRTVVQAAHGEGAPSPLTEHFAELLKAQLAAIAEGGAIGYWRTAVYLQGDDRSYPLLAAAWRGLYTGPASLPEAVHAFDDDAVAQLADSVAMPDLIGPPPPGAYQRPFAMQTLLNTHQLAAYVHLPEQETVGFAVDQVPTFDTVVRQAADDRKGVDVGQVMQGRRVTDAHYHVRLDDLTKHAFVSGVTGAGKTNTLVALLRAAAGRAVPFLVLEPAKTEYRGLLGDPHLGRHLQVFTAGNEQVSPLRINPLEVPAGTPVAVHIDLVRALFTASFGMWTPLPQILERCLHAVYADRGWSITTDRNPRVLRPEDRAESFPTLQELYDKVESVIDALGYAGEPTSNMRAALSTRIDALRIGGKGRMFDTREPTPVATLFDGPVVVELEHLGDDQDKAFLMGLLLIRLAEHRRAQGPVRTLRHVLVFEEAHRLLGRRSGSGGGDRDQADPGGKAVEQFADLLAEVRAYGQGIVVADQVPAKLVPDVLKNTNLKIVHRLLAREDREAVGDTTNMSEEQRAVLVALRQGEAAVFAEGDDAPVLVQIKPAVDDLPRVADAQLRPATSRHRGCGSGCDNDDDAVCAAAALVAQSADVRTATSRLHLSAAAVPATARVMWRELAAEIDRLPAAGGVAREPLLDCTLRRLSRWLAGREGADRAWSYTVTRRCEETLTALLLALAAPPDGAGPAAERLHEFATAEYRRRTDPFPACSRVCPGEERPCLYRYAVHAAVTAAPRRAAYAEAAQLDAAAGAGPNVHHRLHEGYGISRQVVTWAEPWDDHDDDLRASIERSSHMAALCAAQQLVLHHETSTTSRKIHLIHMIVDQYG